MSVHSYEQQLGRFVVDVENGVHPVYQSNIQQVHQHALALAYPCLHTVLAPNRFLALTAVYAQHYPAVFWDINRYGEHFSAFLSEQRIEHQPPWSMLASLAALERNIVLAYYANDDESIKAVLPLMDDLSEFQQALSKCYPFLLGVELLVEKNTVVIERQGVMVRISHEN